MKREFLQSIRVGEMSLPKEVIDAIMAENGKDIEQAKQSGQDWEEKYNRVVESHEKAMQDMHLQNALQNATTKAGGRNVKAIAALLDMEAIAKEDDIASALDRALESLKQENGYLFTQTAPAFARGTGSSMPDTQPVSLADALRQRNRT